MTVKMMRKMALLAKLETTRGVDALPTGAANAMLVSDVTLTPLEGDEVQRNNIKPYFGNSGSKMVTAYNTVQFSVEMAGAGNAGDLPAYAALLRGCAMSATIQDGVSVTFAPVSDDIESLTLYANIDGVNHIMLDAKGTVTVAADPKTLPKFTFNFTGLFVPLTDAPLPTPVYTAFQEPVGVNKTNSTLSLHGITLAASAFAFDAGNTIVKRDLIGVDSVELTDRQSTGSVTFKSGAMAQKNWVASALNADKGPLQLVHGITAGNIVEISAPLAQLGKPTYADGDGVHMTTIPLSLITGDAGNDEWRIVVR